jgi:8-oxo-dGTP pyrophosphatase MutT (NUDIX family)
MEIEPIIRPTVRVLLVDEFNRVLLFRGQDPDQPETRFWFPAGGGIEEGESPQQAARREVQEETGLMEFELGPHIWNRRHVFTFYGSYQDVREIWFFARTPTFEIDIAGFSEQEHNVIREYRWWSQDELESTSDSLTPRSLASLFRGILSDGLPKHPIDVPV